MALTACLYLPIWSGNVALAVFAPTSASSIDDGGSVAWSSVAVLGANSTGAWVIGLLQLIALSLLGVGIGALAVQLSQARDPSFGEIARLVARRWWVAVLIVPINAAVHGAGAFVCGIGWLFADALVFTVSVVAGAEGLGPIAAVGRAWRLSASDYNRALVVCTGGLLIGWIIRVSLSAGPTMLLASLDPESSLIGLVGALSSAVTLLTEPLAVCIAARAYLDLRCRRDGYDLELRRARLGLV